MSKIRKGLESNGKFAKGNKLQSGKRKAQTLSFMKKFEEALKVVEEEQGKTLAQHAIERAYTDDTVLIAILKKFAPDLAHVKIEPDGKVHITFSIKDFREEKGEI